jgi:hypothetical protein
MDTRSAPVVSNAPVAKELPTTWQGYLELFKQEAGTKGFAAHIAEVKARAKAKHFPIDIKMFGPLQIIVLVQRLSRAGLLACLQLPTNEVPNAIGQIVAAADGVRYDHNLPGKATSEERVIYQAVQTVFPEQLKKCSKVLRALFLCYANNDYDPTQDTNDLMRQARGALDKGNHVEGLKLLGKAGAVALRTQNIWQGWGQEGSKEFQDGAHELRTILEMLENVMPLQDVANENAERVLAMFEGDRPSNQSDTSDDESAPITDAEPEEALEVVRLAARKQPLSDDEIREMGEKYELRVGVAKNIFAGRHGIERGEEATEAREFAVRLAIRVLGVLRCQDPEIAEQLIAVIGKSCEEQDAQLRYLTPDNFGAAAEDMTEADIEDMLGEPHDRKAAVVTLGQMGHVAVRPCIQFLHYSNQHRARFYVAEALGVAGRGDDEAFQTLFKLAEETDLGNGKIMMLGALAKTQDDRAIPLVAAQLQAISEPDAQQLSDLYEDDYLLQDDQFKLMDALHDLNAIEALDPAPGLEGAGDDAGDETDDESEPGAVIVRGYGRIANAVPSYWDYPDTRADDDEDEDDFDEYDEYDEYDEFDEGDSDDRDSSFSYADAPKQQPYINTEKVGRNEPCPCGSGKKYKHCHGKDI